MVVPGVDGRGLVVVVPGVEDGQGLLEVVVVVGGGVVVGGCGGGVVVVIVGGGVVVVIVLGALGLVVFAVVGVGVAVLNCRDVASSIDE